MIFSISSFIPLRPLPNPTTKFIISSYLTIQIATLSSSPSLKLVTPFLTLYLGTGRGATAPVAPVLNMPLVAAHKHPEAQFTSVHRRASQASAGAIHKRAK